jgi:hypothetical protein
MQCSASGAMHTLHSRTIAPPLLRLGARFDAIVLTRQQRSKLRILKWSEWTVDAWDRQPARRDAVLARGSCVVLGHRWGLAVVHSEVVRVSYAQLNPLPRSLRVPSQWRWRRAVSSCDAEGRACEQDGGRDIDIAAGCEEPKTTAQKKTSAGCRKREENHWMSLPPPTTALCWHGVCVL